MLGLKFLKKLRRLVAAHDEIMAEAEWIRENLNIPKLTSDQRKFYAECVRRAKFLLDAHGAGENSVEKLLLDYFSALERQEMGKPPRFPSQM